MVFRVWFCYFFHVLPILSDFFTYDIARGGASDADVMLLRISNMKTETALK